MRSLNAQGLMRLSTFALLSFALLATAARSTAVAQTVTVFDNQAAFEATTGASIVSILAAATVGSPIAEIADTGCAESISIPFDTNAITITAPNTVPHDSLPGIAHPMVLCLPATQCQAP